ncbi:MAG: InlB B-repeat-containing protein, partial [Raoultibacter sp.]
PSLSITNRVVASDGSTIIRLVYSRNHVSIAFAAGDHGSLTGTTSFSGLPYGITFGTAVIPPKPVANPGYRFDSWSPALPTSSETINADATYTAVFVKDDEQWATVSFVGNGSTSGFMPASAEMLVGSSYTLPANSFTRTDYDFVNWDTLSSGLGMSYADQETITVTSNTVLYAQWVEREHFAVVYLGGGGVGTLTDTTVYHAGNQVAVRENTFVNPGYKFTNWKDTGGNTFVANDTFAINAQTYLTAQWEYDSSQWVDVAYDKNSPDATGSMPTDTTLVGQQYVVDSNAFTRTHYTFAGWNTDANGQGTSYVEGEPLTPATSSPVTLYAQWKEIPQYTITYVANNGTTDQILVTDYKGSNVTVKPLNTFTFENNDCFRWATNRDGTGDAYFAGNEISLTNDLTLYAFWLPRKHYTETYSDGFSGNSFSESHYADVYGHLDVTVKANPFVRQGYTFSNWLVSSGETAMPGAVMHSVNSDIAFSAQWTPIQNYITYDLNGGTLAGSNPTSYTIETPSFSLINPTKPGYTFAGWTGTNLADPTTSVTIDQGRWGNLAFAATWVKDPMQWAIVTFDGKGNTSGSMHASAEKLIGSTYTLPANSFARTDYDFVNWDTLKSGLGVSYTDQHAITVMGNMTLYAQWVEHGKFAVVYLGNGGTGTMTDTNSYFDGSSVTVLPNEFVNPGYLFKGWKDAGGADYAVNTTFEIHSNTYLSAQWEYDENQWAEIIYDANSPDATGSMPSEKLLVGESRALSSNAFMRSNWAFVEWNSSPDGSGQSFTPGEMVKLDASGPHTFYAQWARISHEARFSDGFAGNSFTKAATLNDQSVFELVIPENPFSRQGYSFKYWQSEAGAIAYPGDVITGIESDLSYTAVWTKTGYSIEYNLDGGTVEGTNPDAYTADTPTFSLINPTKFGYTFAGWTGTHLAEPTLTVTIEKGTEGDLAFTA